MVYVQVAILPLHPETSNFGGRGRPTWVRIIFDVLGCGSSMNGLCARSRFTPAPRTLNFGGRGRPTWVRILKMFWAVVPA
jgi:hypothetical protein